MNVITRISFSPPIGRGRSVFVTGVEINDGSAGAAVEVVEEESWRGKILSTDRRGISHETLGKLLEAAETKRVRIKVRTSIC